MKKSLYHIGVTCFVMLSIMSCRDATVQRDHHVLDFSDVSLQKIDKRKARKNTVLSYGQIDTSDNSLLRFCSFGGIKDSLFLAMDMQKILVVGIDGHVRKRIEHVGRGPNEYLQIYSSTIDKEGERIFILGDYSNNLRVSVYSFSGDFLETIQLAEAGSSICYYEKSLYYTTLPEAESLVRRIDMDKRTDVSIVSPITAKNHVKTAIINLDYLKIEDDVLVYHKALCDTLFRVSGNTLNPFLVFDLGEKSMPVEYQRTLESLNTNKANYINIQNTTFCGGMLYMWFWYKHVLYFDIWDIQSEELVYRNYYHERDLLTMDDSKIGLPISVNGRDMFFWPRQADAGLLFCELSQEDANSIVPGYNPEFNQSFLLIKPE